MFAIYSAIYIIALVLAAIGAFSFSFGLSLMIYSIIERAGGAAFKLALIMTVFGLIISYIADFLHPIL